MDELLGREVGVDYRFDNGKQISNGWEPYPEKAVFIAIDAGFVKLQPAHGGSSIWIALRDIRSMWLRTF